MRIVALLAGLLILAAPTLAEDDHEDELRDAQEDLERAERTASATWTTVGIGALWGLVIGSVLGVAGPLVLSKGENG